MGTSLQTLLEAGAVRWTRDKRLRLCRNQLATSRMDAAGIAGFAEVLAEHIKTCADNAGRPAEEALFSQRISSPPQLDAQAVELLKRRVAERVRALLSALELDFNEEVHAPKPDGSSSKPGLVLNMYLAYAEPHANALKRAAKDRAQKRHLRGRPSRDDDN